MEFDIGECAMLIRKSGKRQTTEGMKLPNQERIRILGEKKNYKYLEILEADTIKQTRDERRPINLIETDSAAEVSSKG